MNATELSIDIAPELSDQQSLVLICLARGSTRSGACSAAGVDRKQFYRWMEKSIVFGQAVLQAEGTAEVNMSNVIVRAAIGGDWRAAAFWLRSRRREQWREDVNIDVVRRIGSILGELEDGGPAQAAGGTGEQADSEEPNTDHPVRPEDNDSDGRNGSTDA